MEQSILILCSWKQWQHKEGHGGICLPSWRLCPPLPHRKPPPPPHTHPQIKNSCQLIFGILTPQCPQPTKKKKKKKKKKKNLVPPLPGRKTLSFTFRCLNSPVQSQPLFWFLHLTDRDNTSLSTAMSSKTCNVRLTS